MIDFLHATWKPALRWVSAIGLVLLAVWIARSVGPFGIIFCLPFLIVATLLTLTELVRPFTWMVDVLMGNPSGKAGHPPIDLRLARSYVHQERTEDALEEYFRVMKWHPRISEPYEQSMRLLALSGSDPRKIERVFRKGYRRLRTPEARADLDKARREAMDLLAAHPAPSAGALGGRRSN